MTGHKSFMKSVSIAKARTEFRKTWMEPKYKMHPDMDKMDVYFKYLDECNTAMVKAGLL